MIPEYAGAREYLDEVTAQVERMVRRHHRVRTGTGDPGELRAIAELDLEADRADRAVGERLDHVLIDLGRRQAHEHASELAQLGIGERGVSDRAKPHLEQGVQHAAVGDVRAQRIERRPLLDGQAGGVGEPSDPRERARDVLIERTAERREPGRPRRQACEHRVRRLGFEQHAAASGSANTA
jgi:hypothetical protein